MLTDFDTPRLVNDMKIAVQKNDFGGPILYRRRLLKNDLIILQKSKKNGHILKKPNSK